VFVRRDRTSLLKLADLTGKSIVAADHDQLAGYLAQARETADAGIDVHSATKLEADLLPEQIVDAVVAGRADAGFLPAGVLEAMAQEGRVRLETFRILNAQRQEGFPFLVSTRLYPDWLFASLPHIAEPLAKKVAIGLLAMGTDTGAPWRAGPVAWTMPADLAAVHGLLRALRLPPYEKGAQFDLRDVLRKYEFEAFAILTITLAMLLAGLAKFRRLNRELASQMMVAFQRRRELEVEIVARQAAESRLRLNASVFENALEGIIVADSAGIIIDVNSAFSRLTGYGRAEAIGKNPRFLKSDRHDKAFYVGMWKTIAETGGWLGEIWNRRKSGVVMVEILHIAAIRDAAGAITHYVGTFSDITVLKETQARLSRATYEAAGCGGAMLGTGV
jgi:PAS domain S-box-containing protein